MLKIFTLIFLIFIVPAYAQESTQEPELVLHYSVQKGDSLYKIAQKFDLGFDEILYANPDLPASKILYLNQTLILPKTHLLPDAEKKGIVINLAETRLYFFTDDEIAIDTFPVSIGADEKTPTGKTSVISKRENPTWTPPASIREENPDLPEVVPAGPDNPLGQFALKLDGSKNVKWQNIMIHGTNAPTSIGSRVSHGCIRLYPWDIEKLFNLVEIGTKVTIVNQPIKANMINNKVYLEVHLKESVDAIFENLGVRKTICKVNKNCDYEIDWQKVDEVVLQNNGIPTQVSFD